ncbi:MAG: GNAT family N-acetyltransferase [bacterium]
MKLINIKRLVDYGLVLAAILSRLKKLGITIEPYYIIQEGEYYGQTKNWVELCEIGHSKFLGKDEIGEVALLGGEADVKPLLHRLDLGHLCFGLFIEDKLVAYMWCDLKEFNYQPYHHFLEKDEAYLYDARVAQSYRGKNLAPFFRAQFYSALKQYSKDTFYSFSEYTNTPAIRFKKKLGARFLKLCLYINLWGEYSKNWVLRDYFPKT